MQFNILMLIITEKFLIKFLITIIYYKPNHFQAFFSHKEAPQKMTK